MKYLIIILPLLTVFVSNAQGLHEGDNLQKEFKKISRPYYFDAPNFTGWTEGDNMLLICDKPNPSDADYVFIALRDTTLIGIFTTKAPNVFMFDAEGNSKLNITSDYFFLPYWVVKRKTNIDPADTSIYTILDKMCEQTLQSNELSLEKEVMTAYQQYQTDTHLPNRHIALLFDSYEIIVTQATEKGEKPQGDVCIPLIKTLSGECLSLYNRIPVIVCIYMGEALQSAGMTDKAREHFKMSLALYPNSIPLQVYNYRLEQDPKKQEQQLAELKKKYPAHWMVKDL